MESTEVTAKDKAMAAMLVVFVLWGVAACLGVGGTDDEVTPPSSTTVVDYTPPKNECQALFRLWRGAKEQGDAVEMADYIEQAEKAGCR